MKGSATALLLGLCLSLASPMAWAQGEFPLTPEETKDANDPLASVNYQFYTSIAQDPSPLAGMPENLADRVSLFTIRLGAAAQVSLLFDPSTPARLYVDRDADKEFSDETPISGTPKTLEEGTPEFQRFARMPGREVEAVHVYDFGHISFPTTGAGGGANLKARVLGGEVGPRNHGILICHDGLRGGEIRVGEKSYRVVVVDMDHDGRFDGTVSLPLSEPSFDMLGVDLNGNGEFDMKVESGDLELMPLPKMFYLDGSYYGIQVVPDGSAIRLEKVEPKLGTLEASAADVELMVLSDCGYRRLSGAEGKWQLPAGTYMLMQIGLKTTDDTGDTWMLMGGGATPEQQEFHIAEGETTRTFDFGPPYTGKTDVRPMGDTLSIGFALVGKAKEVYSPGAVKNGEQLPPPKFEITDESGKVVVSDSFEYG